MTAYDHPLDGHTTHGPWCEAVTGADVPPLAQEAMAAAEAAWIQATVQQPGCEAIAHEAWQAAWAAALEWAEGQILNCRVCGKVHEYRTETCDCGKPHSGGLRTWADPHDGHAYSPHHYTHAQIASLLRQEAGHD